MKSQWDFIERIARERGVSDEALRKWRVRGVPATHRLAIVDRASEEGFALDRRVFDSPSNAQAAE